MSRQNIVSAPGAPAPIPQLSQATVYNGLVFCSGSLGMDPVTGAMVTGTIQDRARRAMLNLRAVLEASGSSLAHVLKVNIYLTDMANFAAFNEVWDEFFDMKDKPVTSTPMCNLPLRATRLTSCIRRGPVSLFTSCPGALMSRSSALPLPHKDPRYKMINIQEKNYLFKQSYLDPSELALSTHPT